MVQVLPEKLRELSLSRFTLPIILINLAGTAFGFYYYREQFAATAPHLWIFVADSPIATFLMAASLLLYLKDRRSGTLEALAAIANIKYGLWTVFILLFYFDTFFSSNPLPMYLFLLFSHLLMFLQAFLVLDYTDFDLRHLAVAASWFLVNDLFDYLLDLHTRIYAPHGHPVSPAMIAAFTLTAVAVGISYHHLRERGP